RDRLRGCTPSLTWNPRNTRGHRLAKPRPPTVLATIRESIILSARADGRSGEGAGGTRTEGGRGGSSADCRAPAGAGPEPVVDLAAERHPALPRARPGPLAKY